MVRQRKGWKKKYKRTRKWNREKEVDAGRERDGRESRKGE